MRKPVGRWVGALLLVGISTVAPAGSLSAEEPRLADYYGFLPLEVYKLDTRINNLIIRDLDGDKTADIVVSNNSRSRIDLLLSSKKASDDEGVPAFLKNEVNAIRYDRRMRLASIPVNKEVVSMVVGEFTGDGKPDIAFYGTPAELIILENDGAGRFDSGRVRRINTGEAVEGSTSLTVSDLNRDGREDLVLLGNNELIIAYQIEKGKFSDPERVPHTSSNPRMLRAVDLDGDGGDDLVQFDGDDEDPVRVRFSIPGGKLGPEQRFHVEEFRAIAFGEIDGRRGAELLTIENQSGRARVYTLDDADTSDSGTTGRLLYYPFPPGDQRGRSIAVGDLDGDGKADVVATDPTSAQCLVYRQSEKSGLLPAQSFPGLIGGQTIRMVDLDGDHRSEVVVLSEKEKQIGRSTYQDGRLTFPTPLPLTGEPVTLETADLNADGTPEIVYVSRIKPGKNVDEEFALRAVKREKDGAFVPFRWGESDHVPLKGLPGIPPAIRLVDVNRDGMLDVLVFNAYGPPMLLLGRENEPPAPSNRSLGPLTGIAPTALTLLDLDGPTMVVSQNTYARSLYLDKEGGWVFKDQYDSKKNAAQILGAASLDLNGDGRKEIVLLDRTSKSLVFLEKQANGVFSPRGSLKIGSIDFQGMHVADLDGDGREDLLIAGTDRFGVLATGRKGQRLRPIASYETNRSDARLSDLIVGDINADNHPDIVLTDTAEHFLEIVTYSGKPELNRATEFRVFERKSFRGGGSLLEPRDIGLGDVDGDGRTDLVLISHDRVLVYRQDSGEPESRPDPAREKSKDQ